LAKGGESWQAFIGAAARQRGSKKAHQFFLPDWTHWCCLRSSTSAATAKRGAPISMPAQAIGSCIQAAITLTKPGGVSM
jgi:hypothetical protein